MKIIWDLPHATHKRFLESLSPVPHLESVLTGRYIGFVQNLALTENSVLGLIFSSCQYNISSQTGQNIRYLMDKNKKVTLKDLVAERQTLKKSRVYNITDEELWKIPVMEELALVKRGILELDVLDDDQVDTLLGLICTE